jgi:hypothetical protein
MSEGPLYMDRPTAERLLNELNKQAQEIRTQYLAACGKPLEGRYFRERGVAYLVKKAILTGQNDSLSLLISLDCCITNSRGEATKRTIKNWVEARRYSNTPLCNPAFFYTFEGILSLGSNGEEDRILFLDNDIFAELIKGFIRQHGSNLTVRYWIADQPLSPDQLNENFLASLYGAAECEYSVRYSEYTGYLGTDEEINVGGHDLLTELKSAEGKFLRMEVEFDF